MVTRAWDGSSGNLTGQADWTPTGAPQAGDLAVIEDGTPQFNGGVLDGFTLQLGGPFAPVELDITSLATFGAGLVVTDEASSSGYTISVTSSLTNDGTIVIASSAAFDVIQDSASLLPSTFVNAGLITIGNGATLSVTSATFTNNGTIKVGSGSTLDVGLGPGPLTSDGTGSVILTNASSAEFGGTDTGVHVTFGDASANVLTIDTPISFTDTISGATKADQIVLVGIDTSTSPANLSYANGTLTVSSNAPGDQVLANLAITGNHKLADFSQISSNLNTTIEVACFAEGSRILTPTGWRRIETLVVGDLVATVRGCARPLTWIGRRHIDCRRHPRPETVWPVRVKADCFGVERPCRDLLLSPDHSVYLQGVLIPICHLVDGTTIAQLPCDQVVYWHVELPTHDVVVAEGVPCESFLDTGQKCAFESDSTQMLHPDFAAREWEAAGYAPVTVRGAEVELVRQLVALSASMHAANANHPAGDRMLRRSAGDPSGGRARKGHRPIKGQDDG